MRRAEFAPTAAADLDAITGYIARDNPAAAVKLIARMRRLATSIASSPGMGRRREDLRPSLRSFPVGSHQHFYRVIDYGIEVARVLHGRRDIDAVFRAETS